MRFVHHVTLVIGLVVCALSASAAVGDQPTLKLANERLSLDIDLRLDGGNVALKDLKTNQLYEAADFGVIRVYDSTEDRMRTLIISPSSTCPPAPVPPPPWAPKASASRWILS